MSKTKACVLVVDDDRNLLESYKLVLGVAGYDFSLATNSVEAINCVTGRRHHVALVDLRIKDEDGIELVKRLKEIDPLLECLVITAYPSHETAVEALKLGASDYLSKTAESETILETIEDALNQRELKEAEAEAEGIQSPRAVSVAVVCDNTLLKRGLADMGRKSKRLLISHFYHNVPMFLKKHPTPPSNITLLCGSCNFKDYQGGLDNLDKIRLTFPETRMVIFNQKMPPDKQVDLLKHGISGFLETDLSEEKTEEMLVLINGGQIVAEGAVMMRALRELADASRSSGSLAENRKKTDDLYLTRREKEIVKCIARGLKNKEIADQLFISEKTVKTHINNVFRKLEVENRLQAINRVYELNLLI